MLARWLLLIRALSKVMRLKQLSPVRRKFLEFLLAVALVHVIAIVLYYGLDVSRADPSMQRRFGWIWMGVTVAVVVFGLRRLKRARRDASFKL
jgi:uncharacterized membrane protein